MNLKELKKLESAYFTSEKSNLREYAKAYKEIYIKCKKYSGLWLSDEILISDMAKKYIQEQMRDMQLISDNSDLRQRIKGASKLIIKNYATKEEVLAVVKKLDVPPKSFEEARTMLEKSYLYNKIKPETLSAVLSEYLDL
ncbi:hypothetical protein [Clostridium sp.]|uniref:hypothetical protein n=1 Tax=Clostridium sp. TaxID=1506 RepID=UPI0025C15031|nr:hypothetical protein [Clostridium sp.]